MFILNINIYYLFLFCTTYLVSFILNLITVFAIEKYCNQIKKMYKQKHEALVLVITKKKLEHKSNITQYYKYSENNYKLDTEQLNARYNKIISNVNTNAKQKLTKYTNIENVCYQELKTLITQILKDLLK